MSQSGASPTRAVESGVLVFHLRGHHGNPQQSKLFAVVVNSLCGSDVGCQFDPIEGLVAISDMHGRRSELVVGIDHAVLHS